MEVFAMNNEIILKLVQPTICKLTDYLTLNAYSAYSPCLYNGKSGIALCLFEIARYLHNNELEDKAFELLQESLVLSNKIKSIDFGNGLSGVEFALLYLIENRFLDADFKELLPMPVQPTGIHLKICRIHIKIYVFYLQISCIFRSFAKYLFIFMLNI